MRVNEIQYTNEYLMENGIMNLAYADEGNY